MSCTRRRSGKAREGQSEIVAPLTVSPPLPCAVQSAQLGVRAWGIEGGGSSLLVDGRQSDVT